MSGALICGVEILNYRVYSAGSDIVLRARCADCSGEVARVGITNKYSTQVDWSLPDSAAPCNNEGNFSFSSNHSSIFERDDLLLIRGLYEAHLPVSNVDNSIKFYQGLGLELAYKRPQVAFLWIEKGRSWLGLWTSEHVNTPYHPSIRHLAFYVELEDIKRVQEWLNTRGIQPRDDFGVSGQDQPLILANDTHYHAAIYFNDPDGNSLEFITPLKLDAVDVHYHSKMTLGEWFDANGL